MVRFFVILKAPSRNVHFPLGKKKTLVVREIDRRIIDERVIT